MVQIAPVRLQYNPKTLWFDPGELKLELNDPVIVSTERGSEFGYTDGIVEVDESQVAQLKSPLKPVLRKATQEDLDKLEELKRKSAEALPRFREMAREMHENMNPVMVEYLFDEDKAIFFFESEERIDFRELVRKLAQEFHVRVDMRQIGVRDEARILGGIGHCGQELCCKRMGGEFNPVTIRMAKEQDLSLNPQKISGVCGRLMCCLRYEYEAYKDFKGRAPKMNASIQTPCGCCKVCDHDVPRERITVKMEEDNKRVTFPLSEMDEPKEGQTRPSSIGDAFEKYLDPEIYISSLEPSSSSTGYDRTAFTREDTLAEPGAIAHNPSRSKKSSDSSASAARGSKKTSRRRHEGGAQNSTGAPSSRTNRQGDTPESPRKRRERSSSNAVLETPRRSRRVHAADNHSDSAAAENTRSRSRTKVTRTRNAQASDTAAPDARDTKMGAKQPRRRTRIRTHEDASSSKPTIRPGQRASSVQGFHDAGSTADASGSSTLPRRRARAQRDLSEGSASRAEGVRSAQRPEGARVAQQSTKERPDRARRRRRSHTARPKSSDTNE